MINKAVIKLLASQWTASFSFYYYSNNKKLCLAKYRNYYIFIQTNPHAYISMY